jgi:DNA-binding NarL/FixJ family response regulator
MKGRLGRGKLTPEQVVEIKRLLSDGLTHADIARRYGVSEGTISQIARGKIWKHVRGTTTT